MNIHKKLVMGLYANLLDADLATLLKRDNRSAFTAIYDRYFGVLLLFAAKLTQEKEEAEDLVQEVFIYLWDKREKLDFTNSLKSYLYTAVRYKFLDMLDHKKVVAKYQQSFDLFIEEGELITDNLVREKELTRLIDLEIAKLPAKMRMVFELSRKEQLTQKEIAELLNISDKTVKKQLENAVKILKLRLGNLFSVLFTGFL